jgi:hypothetical protein
LNVHASTEDKNDDVMDGIYDELGCVFNIFHIGNYEHFVGDLNTKVDRDDILRR